MGKNERDRITPVMLKTNGCVDPIGLDTLYPLFQWQLHTEKRNWFQNAYRIVVSDCSGKEVWDTGKVISDQQLQIPYRGAPLLSMTRYCWRVKVWDLEEAASDWSEEASFEMGILHQSEWQAQWIGGSGAANPLSGLRWIGNSAKPGQTTDYCRSFCLEKPLQQAVFDGAAFESWELFCNGHLCRRMNAEWKQDSTSPIRYADLTEYLHTGENTLLFRVTADAKGCSAVVGKLLLRSDDGTEISVTTDEQWTVKQENTIVPASAVGTYADAALGQPKRRGPAPLLRKEFRINGNVQRARLYICGLGYGVCTINGELVTDALLQTEYSQYHKTVFYHALDVTALIQSGKNCIGVELGRGYYSFHKDWIGIMPEQDEPKLLLQLMIWMGDGHCQTVVSDNNWKTTDGPTVDDNIWYGEKYDARLLPVGWDNVGFDDSAWQNARGMRSPGGKLHASELQPIQVVEQLLPTRIYSPAPKIRVYDFGKVTAGWAAICVNEAPGTRIKLTYGEKLLENGRVDMQTKCAVFQFWEPGQTDIYVCRGGEESWAPKFSYKGFRYIEVEGLDHEITVVGQVLHNNLKKTGTFSCSNELFNRIHSLVTPTILNNFHSIPTDTPTYEKRGWTGDGQLICDTALMNLDAQRFFRKWVQDLIDSQDADGAIPDTCPGPVFYPPAPEWMCAMIVIPYQLYLHCGDTEILDRSYPAMKRYTDYELRRLNDGLSSNLYYGDWNSPAGSCPPEGSTFNATCYVYYVCSIMQKIATLLGMQEDTEWFSASAERIRSTLNTHFFDEEAMLYHTEKEAGFRQTPTLLPLAFGIVPEEKRNAVAASFAKNIRQKDSCHLTTGCMGLKFLVPTLTRFGYSDVANAIVDRQDFPSWGYWLANGATSCWETWDTDSRSYNHFYFGTIDDWFYQYLVGIQPVTAGYKTFRIQPYPCGNLTEAMASIETPYGTICVHWQIADGIFVIDVTVPANTKAKIILPSGLVHQAGSGDYRYEEPI